MAECSALPRGLACHAPFTSLYLNPSGFVHICAPNYQAVLGNVARERLPTLWSGPVASRLRAAIAADDFSVGCQTCAGQISEAGHGAAFARLFDHLPDPGEQPAQPTHIEFAIGNTCNLQCVMCNGMFSSAIRGRREHLAPLPSAYGEQFFADLRPWLGGLLEAKFLGGEPFLVPEMQRVWDMMIEADRSIPCHVTTNGTVMNARVEHVLERLPMSITVSLDGIRPATFEAIRSGARLAAVLENTDRLLAYTVDRGTHLTISTCLMMQNWAEFGELLAYADHLDVDVYVNVLTTPARMSLYRLPHDELADIVAAMERLGDGVRPSLGRNGHVWDEQMVRLRGRLAAVAEGRFQADELRVRGRGSVDQPADEQPDDEQPDDEPADLAAAVAALEGWSGRPAVVLGVDDASQVRRVESAATQVLDVDLRLALDQGMDELGVLLISAFGRAVERTALDQFAPMDHWETRFEGAHGGATVRTLTVYDPARTDGLWYWWVASARPLDED